MTDPVQQNRLPQESLPQSGQMHRVQRIHFVGIGGAGMSGIAEVLLNLGYQVSGSDLQSTNITQRLEQQGAMVYQGHAAEHVQHADVVVTSSAVSADNPEVIAARETRTPVVPRAEMLAELMRFKRGIAIAGTHGKTTTTSLVASVLGEAGMDPTYVIGGRLNSSGRHAKLGEGDYLVAEADESDASFLLLQPVMQVITNIEPDHLSTYEGDFGKLKQSFVDFVHHLPFYGLVVVCADDPVVRELLPALSRPVITYGIEQAADIRATDIRYEGPKTYFTLQVQQDQYDMCLNLPGQHNVLNALAAISIAYELGVSWQHIQTALQNFAGIGRRFQIHGDVQVNTATITLVDDYGHHPTEVKASMQAARHVWPDRRLVVVFQPHRFSRTQELFEDFTEVLCEADVLCLTEVYAAGESKIPGADARSLSAAIRNRGKVNPIFVSQVTDIAAALIDVMTDGDVVLTLGAGNIGQVAGQLPQQLTASAGGAL